MSAIFRTACVWSVVLAASSVVHATSFAPLTFQEQVEESDSIVYGRVLSSTARVVKGAEGDVIMTFTKIETIETFSGSSSPTFELSQVGGTVNGVRLKVDGIPTLLPGDEFVLFMEDSPNSACPLVGMNRGACQVTAGTDGVTFLKLPTMAMEQAQKVLGDLLEQAKQVAGPASDQVAKLLVSQEKIQEKFPALKPTDPATVTLDQLRGLVQSALAQKDSPSPTP